MDQIAVKKEDFCDDESQRIFELRYNFYQTGDWKHLIRLIASSQGIIDRYNNELTDIESVKKIKGGRSDGSYLGVDIMGQKYMPAARLIRKK